MKAKKLIGILLLLSSLATASGKAQVNQTQSNGTNSVPDSKALADLMPLFGHVKNASFDLTKNGKPDAEMFGLNMRDSKLYNLYRDKLGLDYDLPRGNPSNNFVRLPEVVQEIATWPVRPTWIVYQPDKQPALSEVRRILGAEASKEQGDMLIDTPSVTVT